MKTIWTAVLIASVTVLFGAYPAEGAGSLEVGEFRLGAHGGFLTPINKEFKRSAGYGATAKYKFTDTLGIEMGVDYFRWEFKGDVDMPYPDQPGPVYFSEIDRVYPIYFTALLYSPMVEESARGYLGLGGGYYHIDSDIIGSYTAVIDGVNYPFTITGNVSGRWSAHAAVGVDFQLSDHIFLNLEARYVLTKVDREQTHSTPGLDAVTVKDQTNFNNWQIRAGLQYAF